MAKAGDKYSDAEWKEKISHLYLDEQKSLRTVAKELGVSGSFIQVRMKKYGIPTRKKREVNISRDQLFDLYITQKKTTNEIAEILGYSPSVIVRHLHKYDIETRAKKLPENITKTYLYDEYVIKGRSAKDIAQENGVTKKAILDHLRKWNIPVRTQKNAGGVDISFDQFEQLYVYERKSLDELANFFNCSKMTIRKYSKKHGLFEKRDEFANQQVRKLIAEGKNYSEIARLLSMPRSQVVTRSQEMGIKPKFIEALDRLDKEEVVRLYLDERKSMNEIADIVGVSSNAIRNILLPLNVIRPTKIEVDSEQLYKRYVEDKATYAELTAEFNISQITLNRLLRRYGIPFNREVQHSDEWKDEVFEDFVKEWISEHEAEKAKASEIAEYFDVSLVSVWRKVRNLDLYDLFERRQSTNEREWEIWLKEQDISFIPNDRNILFPKEIDFYIPQYKLGIEIDPAATHNSDVEILREGDPKSIRYHQNKTKQAEDKGVRLIHVFDWYDDVKIKEIVLGICRKNSTVYARKTKVAVLTESEEKSFFEKNHLQGYVRSKVSYGLKNNNGELVAAMSFSVPRYGNVEDAEWELLRFANKSGISVVGGASKLFSYFVRENNPETVMSFCNYDISTGNLYEHLNFEYVRTTDPSYYWVNLTDSSEWYSWYLINSKGVDNVFGTNYGKDASNIDLMLDMGYVRVYNSGNKVYLWKKIAD